MKREHLLRKLSELDFVATDLALYLDTHPCDKEVIRKYNETIKKADAVRTEYESNYGPLCSYRSLSNCSSFSWIDCPWPWQSNFNYNV